MLAGPLRQQRQSERTEQKAEDLGEEDRQCVVAQACTGPSAEWRERAGHWQPEM